MTEDQAIERITDAFKRDVPGCSRDYLRKRATVAWNEIKDIAREDEAWPYEPIGGSVF